MSETRHVTETEVVTTDLTKKFKVVDNLADLRLFSFDHFNNSATSKIQYIAGCWDQDLLFAERTSFIWEILIGLG